MSTNEDNSNRCVFFFADGRRCQLPSAPDDMGLCYFHAHKYRREVHSEQFGRLISAHLDHDALTASDLTASFATLFRATAMGHIKPKTAIALTLLGQLLFRTQQSAKEEFRETFKTPWREVVEESLIYNLPADSEDSSTSSTAPAASTTEATDNPDLDPAAENSEPQPSPHKIM